MVRSSLGRRGGGGARKKYAESDPDDSEPETMPKKRSKPEEDVYITDSSEDEAPPPARTPKAPPKKRKSDLKKISKTVYKEADSDDSGPDDAELEGDDSDFDVGKSSKKKKPAAKPKAKSAKKNKKAAASPKKKAAASRASGRSPKKPVRYSVDSESEEESEIESESEEEIPVSKRKQVGKKAMKKTVQRTPQHPPVSEMIPTAIRKLKENPRKGSSVAAIKGFMAEEWGVNIKSINNKIKNFLINAAEDGEIIRKSGSGAAGRFTLPGMKHKPKKKRKKIIKSDEEDNAGEELEYKPAKRARDEDREREEADKEIRRQHRQELEYKRQLEKEAQPKRHVEKKTEYEVEFIKAKKEVNEEVFYQVKFKGYKKLCWEPEENVVGCQDLIENFYLEEKIRIAEEEDRKKAAENGEFEVNKIMEVRFPKGKEREFLIRWKGFGEDDDTWEAESRLNCDEKIDRFMDKHEKISAVEAKSLRVAPKSIQRLEYASSKREARRNNGFRKCYVDMED